jgi:hypothetical protein
MRTLILILTWLSLLGSASSAHTWRVPTEAPTIGAALSLAGAGDVVEVACGIYFEHDLAMLAGVTLRSETGDPTCVTIDAQQLGRVVLCDHIESFRLEGLTLTGGAVGDADGGGVACLNADGAFVSCRFTDNRAGRGGGAYIQHSSLMIANCRFDANGAASGGGLACYHSDPLLTGCEFSDNVDVIDGAGLYLAVSSPHLTDCLFLRNDAMFFGGGVACSSDARPVFERCTLALNEAFQGGGLWAVDDSVVEFHASLVAFNTQGTGVYMYDDTSHPSTVDLDCSDVFGNAGGNYGGLAADQTGVDGNLSADPLFCDAAAGDFTLNANSPCAPTHNECGVQIGALGAGCGLTPVPASAASLAFHPCFPNPFNPRTTLSFTLPAASPALLEIYALDGTRIARLLDEPRPAGSHAVVWDGCDDQGRAAPAGIYVGRLAAAGKVSVQRLALVR